MHFGNHFGVLLKLERERQNDIDEHQRSTDEGAVARNVLCRSTVTPSRHADTDALRQMRAWVSTALLQEAR